MKTLLEKTRANNQVLKKMAGKPVDLFQMAEILSKNTECTVFIVGKQGQIIGYSIVEGVHCSEIDRLIKYAECLPEWFIHDLTDIQETEANVTFKDGRKCIFNIDNPDCSCENRIWTICPVFWGTRRIGTLILTRKSKLFTEEDIILTEYGTIAVANEIMGKRTERIAENARKKASVQIALATLSYVEREAIDIIMTELDGKEGLLVASRIADKAGISRSVIVSGLRKLESAGVIESSSLGMKGTHIKVLNDYFLDEL